MECSAQVHSLVALVECGSVPNLTDLKSLSIVQIVCEIIYNKL